MSLKIKPETLFIRHFTGELKNGKGTVNLICQPYCVGMYIAGDDPEIPGYIQWNIEYKNYFKFMNSIKKNKRFESITIDEQPLGNYLSDDEILNYLNN